MASVWRKVSPYWHIITGVAGLFVAAVLWVNDVSSYGGRIAKLETSYEHLNRMDFNIQMIARKVGVKPIESPEHD